MRIALTGNPNSGKTTLYNALTGRSERVGNWAGVTVDKNESVIRKAFYSGPEELIAVDLPGAYSMSPFTSEESITRDYVHNDNPDVLINIVDSANLSRSLFFTTQLLELGIPMVVALNKTDVNKKKGNVIDAAALSQKLGCPVIPTTAIHNGDESLSQVVAAAVKAIGSTQTAPYHQGEVDLADKKAVKTADTKRFSFVHRLVSQVETRKTLTKNRNNQDALDGILINKWLGIPIFAVVMWLVFGLSQTYVGPFFSNILCGWIDAFGAFVADLIAGASPFLQALVVDGIIGGVGAVVSFLPLVMVMYFLIALLEDCGYMARVAVVMDPIFKKVGLSGKSIIPMVIGTGCAIPGVMACRTIRNERERRTTAMLAPWMPCGAKLPVIGLFAGAFFQGATWVGVTMYFAGVLLIFLGALMVRRITGNRRKKSFFIMELPEYKLPSLYRAFWSMMERAKSFLIKAGTVILICNTVLMIMQTFNWSFQEVGEGMTDTSILASIAGPFSILLIPLGFGLWQFAAGAITGFIAKENVVATLAVVFAMSASILNQDSLAIMDGAANQVMEAMSPAGFTFTASAALAYLCFNLFTPPCFAAMGAMASELDSKKWLFAGLALQFGTGYTVAFLVYQIGTLITTGSVGTGFIPGLIACGILVGIVCYLMAMGDKKVAKVAK